MENNRNKPFYLKASKSNGKSLIIAGIFLVVLALANPFLLIAAAIVLVWGYIVLKKGRSELNVFLDEAIELYTRKEETKSLVKLENVLRIEKDNAKALIISALIKYNQKEYAETIEFLRSIPKELVKGDLDIQLKLADSYLKTKDYKNAEIFYKDILKLQPKSEFIKKAINECVLQHEET